MSFVNSQARRYAVVFVPVALLLAHAIYYLPFVADDALISLRYSQRLLDGEGLTWTDGPRVEGYSNLLWVLLCAIPGLLGIDLVQGMWVLGVVCMAVPLRTIVWEGDGSAPAALLLLVAGSFYALSGPIAVWAVGGLEQGLLAALLALALLQTYPLLERPETAGRMALGVLLGLLCWTRPDGPLFAVAVGIAVLLCGGLRHWRRVWPVFAIATAFWLAQLFFRLGYYGDWVPNTARVKIAASPVRLQQGFAYVLDGWRSLSPYSWIGFTAVLYELVIPALRTRGILHATVVVLWLAYVIVIGGDIFPAWRHYVPVIVVWFVATADAARHLAMRPPGRRGQVYLVLLLSAVFLFFHAIQQRQDPQNRRGIKERWEWDGKAIGTSLKQAFSAQRPLVAVTAAGSIPYWSELPSLDLMGLNDDYLPRNPPRDFGTGFIGHELGDGRYTLARRPDLIIFHMGGPPVFRAGEELMEMPEFHALYGTVRFRLPDRPDLKPTIYVLRDSEKLGYRADAMSLQLPAVLLASETGAELAFSADGKLVLPLHAGQPAVRYHILAEDFDAERVEVVGTETNRAQVNARRTGAHLIMEVSNSGDDPVLVEAVILHKRPRSVVEPSP